MFERSASARLRAVSSRPACRGEQRKACLAAQWAGTGYSGRLLWFLSWRRKHADSQVRSTGYLHPMRLNIGLVALDSQQAIIDAASAVISQAQSSGDLARWAAASGVTYLQPEEPHVSFGPNMASLMQAK